MVVEGVHLGKIVGMIQYRETIIIATEGCIYGLDHLTGELTPIPLCMAPVSPVAATLNEEVYNAEEEEQAETTPETTPET